jgi:hypothetical protein
MATHIYTSIIANYIPKARVLAHSVKRCHPEAIFHLFISDALPAGFDPANEPFDKVWTVEDLGLENAEQWLLSLDRRGEHRHQGFALLKLLELPGVRGSVLRSRYRGPAEAGRPAEELQFGVDSADAALTAPEKTLGRF